MEIATHFEDLASHTEEKRSSHFLAFFRLARVLNRRESRFLEKSFFGLTSVAADEGDLEEALYLAEKATFCFLRCGDKRRFSEAIVTQGIWLYNLGRPKDAIESLAASLDLLPSGISRHRIAALQNLGLAHHSLGELDASRRYAEVVENILSEDDVWDRGKLLWLRGKIQADSEKLEEAGKTFAEVVSIFQRLHYGETALATCELVRVYLIQGRHEDAYKTATSMRALVEPLSQNKTISAAILDLLRCGQAGLTLALVSHVEARIEGERQKKRTWSAGAI